MPQTFETRRKYADENISTSITISPPKHESGDLLDGIIWKDDVNTDLTTASTGWSVKSSGGGNRTSFCLCYNHASSSTEADLVVTSAASD